MTSKDTTTASGDCYQSALDSALAARRSAGQDEDVVVVEHAVARKTGNPPWLHYVTVAPVPTEPEPTDPE